MIYRRRPVLRAAAVGGLGYRPGRTARSASDAGVAPAARVPTQPTPSTLDQLAHLNALRRGGALTEAEFAIARARLLRS